MEHLSSESGFCSRSATWWLEFRAARLLGVKFGLPPPLFIITCLDKKSPPLSKVWLFWDSIISSECFLRRLMLWSVPSEWSLGLKLPPPKLNTAWFKIGACWISTTPILGLMIKSLLFRFIFSCAFWSLFFKLVWISWLLMIYDSLLLRDLSFAASLENDLSANQSALDIFLEHDPSWLPYNKL